MSFEGWREEFEADTAEQARHVAESEAWHRKTDEQFRRVARDAVIALRDAGAPVIPVPELF